MKMLVLQTMLPVSGFQMVPNWSKIVKKAMTSQFVDMTLFFGVVLILWSSLVTVPSFMSMHLWFWSYDNFLL